MLAIKPIALQDSNGNKTLMDAARVTIMHYEQDGTCTVTFEGSQKYSFRSTEAGLILAAWWGLVASRSAAAVKHAPIKK
jgi:hypothetical protein